MESPYRLLLVAGLLAALLPAAAATFRQQQQPGGACAPTVLSAHVLLFCRLAIPTSQCCQPLVSAVDLGGGVGCVCRVAAEPELAMTGLSATRLLALYISCGGRFQGGAQLNAACQDANTSTGRPKSFQKVKIEVFERREESIQEEGNEKKDLTGLIEIDNPNLVKPKIIEVKDVDVDRTTDWSRPERDEIGKQTRKDLDRLTLIQKKREESIKKETSGCNSSQLALSIVNECIHNFTSTGGSCCSFNLPTSDIENCLCMVADEPDIVDAGVTSTSLFHLYIRCGGKRRANDNLPEKCDDATVGYHGPGILLSPPPPRDEDIDPTDASNSDHGLEVASDVGVWILCLLFFCALVCSTYLWKTGRCVRAEPTTGTVNSTMVPTHTTSGGDNSCQGTSTRGPNSATQSSSSNALVLDSLAQNTQNIPAVDGQQLTDISRPGNGEVGLFLKAKA